MKKIKNYDNFINENYYKDNYYEGYDKYPEDILSYSYQPENDVRDLDGKKVWEKANQIGLDALNKYKAENPDDKHGGSSVMGSGIYIKQVEFPNPVSGLQMAAFETFGMNRLQTDDFKKEEGSDRWYIIPNRIAQGSTHQEVYAKPIVEYLNSLGFEASYNYGRMD